MHYPVTRCLNPRRIVNPYTGESMVVPCGHCMACALNRSASLQLWCDLEAQSSRYCVFVTLTYANRFIPRAQLLDSIERPFGHDLVTSDGEILGSCDIPESEVQKLRDKTYLFGDIPYLRKDDLQKFLKRFRYYVSKVTKSKVRYFACGEYGPVHYRPHYHLLLFFNSPTVLEICRQSVLQAWPFGRVDVQLSKGSCSQYVAGYVNSTCALPKVYLSRAIRPFQLHSSKLGCAVLQGERKEIYELPVQDFIKRSLTINGKYREFSLWRSFYAAYYPKCKGFATLSASECLDAYRIYGRARRAFPASNSCIDLARQIACCVKYFPRDKETFGRPGVDGSFDADTYKVVNYFYDAKSVDYDVSSEEFSRYIQRIYTELLLSKHFLYFCCDGDLTLYKSREMIRRIKEFYSQLDYLHLTEFYATQSVFFDNWLFGSDDLIIDEFDNTYCPYFYDNVQFNMEDYKVSLAYRLMSTESAKLYVDRIKHKELYDFNGIFFDDNDPVV